MKKLIILWLMLSFSREVFSKDLIYIQNQETGLIEQLEIDETTLDLILEEQLKVRQDSNSTHNFRNGIDERIDSGDRTKG